MVWLPPFSGQGTFHQNEGNQDTNHDPCNLVYLTPVSSAGLPVEIVWVGIAWPAVISRGRSRGRGACWKCCGEDRRSGESCWGQSCAHVDHSLVQAVGEVIVPQCTKGTRNSSARSRDTSNGGEKLENWPFMRSREAGYW